MTMVVKVIKESGSSIQVRKQCMTVVKIRKENSKGKKSEEKDRCETKTRK